MNLVNLSLFDRRFPIDYMVQGSDPPFLARRLRNYAGTSLHTIHRRCPNSIEQKVGHQQQSFRGRLRTRDKELSMSFRNPPEGSGYLPALSAPVGHRGILAEVRAFFPPIHYLAPQPFPGPNPPAGDENIPPAVSGTNITNGTGNKHVTNLNANARSQAQGGTMSRGNNGGKSVARMDAFTWLSNVKVGGRKESSSGPGSAAGSAGPSRVGSGSRVRSVSPSVGGSGEGRRSESYSRSGTGEDGGSGPLRRESDAGQSLQDEYVFQSGRLS